MLGLAIFGDLELGLVDGGGDLGGTGFGRIDDDHGVAALVADTFDLGDTLGLGENLLDSARAARAGETGQLVADLLAGHLEAGGVDGGDDLRGAGLGGIEVHRNMAGLVAHAVDLHTFYLGECRFDLVGTAATGKSLDDVSGLGSRALFCALLGTFGLGCVALLAVFFGNFLGRLRESGNGER